MSRASQLLQRLYEAGPYKHTDVEVVKAEKGGWQEASRGGSSKRKKLVPTDKFFVRFKRDGRPHETATTTSQGEASAWADMIKDGHNPVGAHAFPTAFT